MNQPVPAGYYDNVNHDLLAWVPVTARRVLEVGCGAGALGAAFLRRQPAAAWFGVEINEAEVVQARKRLTAVACCDVEQNSNPHALAPASVDALVLGDVLEHLRDPWATLAALVPLLRPDGVLIVCLPNVGHWSVIAGLIAGRFDYANAGLLDRTHLRFFTRSSAQQLVTSAGFVVRNIGERRIGLGDEAQRFIRAGAALANLVGSSPREFANSASAYQFVIRATPKAVNAPVPDLEIRQLVFSSDAPHGRTGQAEAMLSSLVGVSVHVHTGAWKLAPAPKATAAIFLIHGLALAQQANYLESIARLMAAGYLVVLACDDAAEVFCEDQASREFTTLALQACHAVQASSHDLGEAVRAHNPQVVLFENQLAELPPLTAKHADPLTVFCAGSGHESDWAPTIDAFNRALASQPQVQVVVADDRALFARIATANKRLLSARSSTDYLAALQSAQIAWLPLADTPVNGCRSDLASVEAGANAVAILASSAMRCAGLRHGVTGLSYANPEAFASGLGQLLSDSALRSQLGTKARAWVMANRMMANHVHARRDGYLTLWAQRVALTEAVFDRVPWLRARVAEIQSA